MVRMPSKVKTERTHPRSAKSDNVKQISKSTKQSNSSVKTRAVIHQSPIPSVEQNTELSENSNLEKKNHPKKKIKPQKLEDIVFQTYVRKVLKEIASDCSITSGALELIDKLVSGFQVAVVLNAYDVCASTHQGIQTLKKAQIEAGIRLTIEAPALRKEICEYSDRAVKNYWAYVAEHERQKVVSDRESSSL